MQGSRLASPAAVPHLPARDYFDVASREKAAHHLHSLLRFPGPNEQEDIPFLVFDIDLGHTFNHKRLFQFLSTGQRSRSAWPLEDGDVAIWLTFDSEYQMSF